MQREYILVLTTTATEQQAAQFARGLVESRLAACVHIDTVRSIYRWQGAVPDEPEWQLAIKTTPARYVEVEQFIKAHHTYDTPEILCIDIAGGAADYLRWIDACVGNAD